MEREIYISKLNDIITLVKKNYNKNIWFVEIFGKRKSFIAGDIKKLPISNFKTISITEKLGFVITKDIDEKIENNIIKLIRDTIKL